MPDALDMLQEAVASLSRGHPEEAVVAVNKALTGQFSSMPLICCYRIAP
jgi:hypothetical protein